MYKSSSCSISIPILGIVRDFYFNYFHGNVVISHVVLILISLVINGASQVALVVKNLSANAGDGREPRFSPWVGKGPLEKEMATHSSILAWRISWTKETGRLNRLSMLASDSWCWSSFHALDYHSYTFSDVSVQVFCPFFSLSCLAAWALRVIYIFWILVLYQLCVLKIFYVILWLDFSFSW